VIDFEAMYLAFLRRGGFFQPCVSEDAERYARQKDTRPIIDVKTECPHGKTALTCPTCYQSGFERGNAV
jgi:hypothetical protein